MSFVRLNACQQIERFQIATHRFSGNTVLDLVSQADLSRQPRYLLCEQVVMMDDSTNPSCEKHGIKIFFDLSVSP
jgi:hypothetical protein